MKIGCIGLALSVLLAIGLSCHTHVAVQAPAVATRVRIQKPYPSKPTRLSRQARIKEINRFLVLLNKYRKQKGRKPLVMDKTLERAAQWMGEDMAKHNYRGHTDSRGRDPFKRMAAFGYNLNTYKAENVAGGFSQAEEVLRGWKNSPRHNANMLNRHFKVIGIGFAYNPKSKYGWYWATKFGGEKSSGKRK